jgi:hypothetical protein
VTDAPKKPGGARPGAGRKKTPAPVEIIDGRTVTGKDHAQQLLDQLNAIDPQMMQERSLCVSEDPLKAPKDATDEEHEEIEELEAKRRIALRLKIRAEAKFQKLSYEVQRWALLWFSFDQRIALETRRYIYDKARGKAVITVNHLHDKPTEHIVTHTLSERFRIAMQKADDRVSNGRAN